MDPSATRHGRNNKGGKNNKITNNNTKQIINMNNKTKRARPVDPPETEHGTHAHAHAHTHTRAHTHARAHTHL
jgi:hypothetical protein